MKDHVLDRLSEYRPRVKEIPGGVAVFCRRHGIDRGAFYRRLKGGSRIKFEDFIAFHKDGSFPEVEEDFLEYMAYINNVDREELLDLFSSVSEKCQRKTPAIQATGAGV